ncbi:hypothetical protein HMPREF0043_01299 [Actinobaculum sp. oral taxon 183 str. F0552]|nr:hypothetical protein HMPREF0043_01299 [Actinobaculum sp. oral taxon 183 str. F0552]
MRNPSPRGPRRPPRGAGRSGTLWQPSVREHAAALCPERTASGRCRRSDAGRRLVVRGADASASFRG